MKTKIKSDFKDKSLFDESKYFAPVSEEVVTIPNEADDIRDLIKRYTYQELLSMGVNGAIYDDDPDFDSVTLSQVRNMDITEVEEFVSHVQSTLDSIVIEHQKNESNTREKSVDNEKGGDSDSPDSE